ncbi:hypothetical protein R3P38DRAFT_2791528 [Favolaschia claudopus]|uniref:Uncharacterized protein n=1 Tax=Favolaschia claudopus TaxID=2862362 RepID=A0AAW0AH31_9AGAR
MNVPHIAQQTAQTLNGHIVHNGPSTRLIIYQNPAVVSLFYFIGGEVTAVFYNRPAGQRGMSSFYLGPASGDAVDLAWHNASLSVLSDVIVNEGFYTIPTREKIHLMWLAGPNGRSGLAGLNQATMIAIDHAPAITNLVPTNLTVGTKVRALVQLCKHEKLSPTGQVDRYLYLLMLQSLEVVALPP